MNPAVGSIRSCLHLLRPCLAFTAAGDRFLYSPEEERLFRIRTELATFQIAGADEVSRLEGQLAIARAIDRERDLVFGKGPELGVAREILHGAPRF